MNIDKFISFLTFIPWIAIFIISILRNLNDNNYREFSFKYLKNNFLGLFRLDTLFLIIIFFYFASFKKVFVDKYLFAAISLYLCVNSLYEKKSKRKKNFFKTNLFNLIILFIIMLVPFIIFISSNNLVLTYKIMLVYLILEYPIILIVCYLEKFKNKIFKKKTFLK